MEKFSRAQLKHTSAQLNKKCLQFITKSLKISIIKKKLKNMCFNKHTQCSNSDAMITMI